MLFDPKQKQSPPPVKNWEAGSAFFTSGSFAYRHLQLHYINLDFFFTFGAVKRKVEHRRICIHLCPGFSIADWAMNPT